MIDDTLNEGQKQAIEYFDQSLIVLAGPGAGKTKVLTHRIAHILNKSANERFKILALTFTNKAADEMRTRIGNMVKDANVLSRVFIGPFHGFAYQTLKSYGSYIDIPSDFVIYEKREDLQKLLFDALVAYLRTNRNMEQESFRLLYDKYSNTTLLEKDIPTIFFKIEKIKNQNFTAEAFKQSYLYSEEMDLILDIYHSELEKYNVLDFSDLILKAISLFKELPFLRKDYQRIYKHILVDEAQDTNKIQFELLALLCGEQNDSLFVVADEDQVIYEWNDARFEYLLKLQNMYHAETIQLNETYRCPSRIIEAANNLIAHNKSRLQGKLRLTSHNENEEDSIVVNSFETHEDEIKFIVDEISKMNDYSSCAVISRNRKILDDIDHILKQSNIPTYSPSVQDKFVSRELNLILYVLKAIVNENDKIAIYNLCQHFKLDYGQVIDNNDFTLLQQFIKILDSDDGLLKLIESTKNDKENFIKYVESYIEEQISIQSDDVESKGNINIKEDQKNFKKYHKRFEDAGEKGLANFLNFIVLTSNNRINEDGVALLTGHAAKGLEFDHVFVVSLNEGVFPDFRAVKANGGELEEERRNCYVAITRTKKKLYLSYAEKRHGVNGFFKIKPSRFIEEMELGISF